MAVFSPCKRTVILTKYCWNCLIVLVLEIICNQNTCILLIGSIDLFLCETSHTGNFSVHIVCMGSSIAGNASSGLSPACGPWRVGVYNTADFWKSLIQFNMGRSVRRRVVSALDFVALQIHDHHIFRSQLVIIHSAGFNSEIACLSVDLAYIAPGKGYQVVLWQKHICLIDCFF